MTTFTELLRKAEQLEQYWVSAAQIEFSLKIADIMKEDKLNQKQLAEILEVSPAYVSKLLVGNQNLTLNTMIRYARKLDRVFSFDLKKVISDKKVQLHTIKDSAQYSHIKLQNIESTSTKIKNTTIIDITQINRSDIEMDLMEAL